MAGVSVGFLLPLPPFRPKNENNNNITIEFMFAGINMFWARLDSF